MSKRGRRRRGTRRVKRQPFQCPWCGRQVRYTRKKNIEPHINQAGDPCVGQGMSAVFNVEKLIGKEGPDDD